MGFFKNLFQLTPEEEKLAPLKGQSIGVFPKPKRTADEARWKVFAMETDELYNIADCNLEAAEKESDDFNW